MLAFSAEASEEASEQPTVALALGGGGWGQGRGSHLTPQRGFPYPGTGMRSSQKPGRSPTDQELGRCKTKFPKTKGGKVCMELRIRPSHCSAVKGNAGLCTDSGSPHPRDGEEQSGEKRESTLRSLIGHY